MTLTHNVLNVWGGGQLLAFSGIDGRTDFDHGLCLRTAFDATAFDCKLPGECRLWFSDSAPVEVFLTGDAFTLTAAAFRVSGAFVDAHHLLVEGPCEVRGRAPEIAAATRRGRTLIGTAGAFNPGLLEADLDALFDRRTRWLREITLPAGLAPERTATVSKALSQMKTQVYAPEGAIERRFTTPDRWPHRFMWLWDSAFHAVGFRHVDPELAREVLEAVLDGQRDDGFVPIRFGPDGATARFTQPPVLAFAAELVASTGASAAGPDAWLARLFPGLEACVQWDLDNRDSDGAGLAEWAIEGNPECRSGESGQDNSPRFDAATQLDATDFNSFLALEAEVLARTAGRLGRAERERYWRGVHERLCALINERLWSEELGFYVDYDVAHGTQLKVMASSGFLPLICGACSEEQAVRLEQRLRDPAGFGTCLPVPSIAASDSQHYRKDMWRGPVWVNVNWLIAYGFDRYGRHDAADLIRRRTCEEIERRYLEFGTLFEFFDDRCDVDPPQLSRKGRCAPEVSPYHQVFHDYGWTATLYVDMIWSRAADRRDLPGSTP